MLRKKESENNKMKGRFRRFAKIADSRKTSRRESISSTKSILVMANAISRKSFRAKRAEKEKVPISDEAISNLISKIKRRQEQNEILEKPSSAYSDIDNLIQRKLSKSVCANYPQNDNWKKMTQKY
jgi:hypothetical protein